MNVLVTGATGFVGRHLLAALAAAPGENGEPLSLFGTTRGDEPVDLSLPATLIHAELTDPDDVAQVIEASRPDAVFHLAGFASGAGTDSATISAANVDATRFLLHTLAAAKRPCRVLLASTGYVYGDTSTLGRPAREDDPLAPKGAYAQSKAAMEGAAHEFSGQGDLSLTAVRAFNHTGPGQSDTFAVPAFVRQIARIETGEQPPIMLVGNLDAVRDFLDVRDVVDVYRRLIFEISPEPWRVVNVSSGTGVAMGLVLQMAIQHAQIPINIETDPARLRPSELAACIGDASRLHALTGWSARYPLAQTLDDTLQWWRGRVRS